MGQKTKPPFEYKNVPKHYFEKEKKPTSESWLKIKKIEKFNPPLLVTHFKSWDGKPIKKQFVQGRIYVLEPLKTSISTECDCPLDDGEVTMNPEKKDVYIKSRQRPSKT